MVDTPRTTAFVIPGVDWGWGEVLPALQHLPDAQIVGVAADATEALRELAALPAPPDLLLVAVAAKDGDAARFHRTLAARYPPSRIAAFGASYDPAVDALRIELGVPSYLCWDELSPQTPLRLERVLAALVSGVPQQTPTVASAAVARCQQAQRSTQLPWSLTDAEQEVATLLAVGLRPKEIAGKLHLSDSTMKRRMRQLRQKLRADSLVELGERLERYGFHADQPDRDPNGPDAGLSGSGGPAR